MKNIKKYVFVALIGLFFTLGLPKVSASETIHGISNGAYTLRYKNLNDLNDNVFVFQEIPLGTNSTLSSGGYLSHNGNTYFAISDGFEIFKFYTIYVRFVGSSNLTFNCNSNLTNVSNFSWKFSGGTVSNSFKSFRTSCDSTNNYLYVTFTIQAPSSVGSSFVLYWDDLGDYYSNSLFYNSSNSTGTVSVFVDKVVSSDSDNSVIIEQNETIINQNQQQIEQNETIIENQNTFYDKFLDFVDQQKESQDKTNETLTDETPPELEVLDDAVGWLPPGPVDSILNLPLAVFQSLSNSLGKSCEPVQLPIPYINETLELPCVSSLYAKMGVSDYIETIGIVASAFILLGYLLNLYKWVDDQLSLRENTWNDMDQWGGV